MNFYEFLDLDVALRRGTIDCISALIRILHLTSFFNLSKLHDTVFFSDSGSLNPMSAF